MEEISQDFKDCLIYFYSFIFDGNFRCECSCSDFDFLTFVLKIKENKDMSFSFYDIHTNEVKIPKDGYLFMSITDLGPEFYFGDNVEGNRIISIFSVRNYSQFKEAIENLEKYFEFERITEKICYDFSFILIFQLFKYLLSKNQLFSLRNNLTSEEAIKIKKDEYFNKSCENKNYKNLLIIEATLKNRDKDNLFKFCIRQENKLFRPNVQILAKAESSNLFKSWTCNSTHDYENLYSNKNKSLINEIIEDLIREFWLPF